MRDIFTIHYTFCGFEQIENVHFDDFLPFHFVHGYR